jgi:hypothetical protein
MVLKPTIALLVLLFAAGTAFADGCPSCGCDAGHCSAGIDAHLSCSRATAAERAILEREVAQGGPKWEAYLKLCESQGRPIDEDDRKGLEKFKKVKEGLERLHKAETAEKARRADEARKEAERQEEIRRRAATDEVNRKVEVQKQAEATSLAQSKQAVEDLARQIAEPPPPPPAAGGRLGGFPVNENERGLRPLEPLSQGGAPAAPRGLAPLGALGQLQEAAGSGQGAARAELTPLSDTRDPKSDKARDVFDREKRGPHDPVVPLIVPGVNRRTGEWVVPPDKMKTVAPYLDNRQKAKDELSTLEKEYDAAKSAGDTVTMARIQTKKTTKESEIATIDITIEEALKPPSTLPPVPPEKAPPPPPPPTETPKR